MRYIKYLILIIVLCAGNITAQDFADTLESGSSDSLLKVSILKPARLVTIQFKQLDTNGTASGGSPDSVKLFNNVDVITSPVDFNCSVGDSLKQVIDFSGARKIGSNVGETRAGWVWQPNITYLWIQMANAQYLTNRKIYVEVVITYY